MARVPLRADVSDGDLMAEGFARIRGELGLPVEFPAPVLEAAAEAAADVAMPDLDMTDVPLVTLDPKGSRDLDQAMHIERRGAGYRVWYAIADVPAYAPPGGAVEGEALRRGVTYYCPDRRVPLHPPVLSEDGASLLPGVDRSAFLWQLDLDSDGDVTASEVRRARVRSRAQYDYGEVQDTLEQDRAEDIMVLLTEVGRLRLEQEAARGGVSLALPRQLVVPDAGGYRLVSQAPAEIEAYNAQISLMTGMAAAEMMLAAGAGILRTMPEPGQFDLDRVRAVARVLRLRWPGSQPYPEFIRSLDPADPRTLPMLNACTMLMRGAGYHVVGPDMPIERHAAVAAPYAHVTAPLRRLVDRYGLVAATAACAGRDVPEWVLAGMPAAPGIMKESDQRARSLERANVDLVEAGVLHGREGEEFVAVGLDSRRDRTLVQLNEPAVLAMCNGDVPLGVEATVRLERADVQARLVEFSIVEVQSVPAPATA